MMPRNVLKRDGRMVPFELERIASAIARALHAVGGDDPAAAEELARVVAEHLERVSDHPELGIEEVQDAVVLVLQESGHYEAAIAYTRYRDARERERRMGRVRGCEAAAPNLVVIDCDGRRRPWERAALAAWLTERLGLDRRPAEDAVVGVEELLAGSDCTELSAPLFFGLVDAALVRCGRHAAAAEAVPLRLDRPAMRRDLQAAGDGREALLCAGRRAFHQLSLAEGYPAQVVRLYCRGRLWVDGLDDPRRGSQITLVIDSPSNPWLILTQAFAIAAEANRHWRLVRLVLPASILGHLERGALQLIAPISSLAGLAQVHLYCDGRTPLLDAWPFTGVRPVGLATYQEDFLLLQRLQELGLPSISGAHLAQAGWVGKVSVELALNAQGLEGEFSQMDALAMALVSAARVRLAQLGPLAQGAEPRFAVFGLAQHSPSFAYLERQVLQEGLRHNLSLLRGVNLPPAACEHLGRLLD